MKSLHFASIPLFLSHRTTTVSFLYILPELFRGYTSRIAPQNTHTNTHSYQPTIPTIEHLAFYA